MLQLKGIELSYNRPILKAINFEIAKGEIVGIVGKSGAGKTVFLNLTKYPNMSLRQKQIG